MHPSQSPDDLRRYSRFFFLPAGLRQGCARLRAPPFLPPHINFSAVLRQLRGVSFAVNQRQGALQRCKECPYRTEHCRLFPIQCSSLRSNQNQNQNLAVAQIKLGRRQAASLEAVATPLMTLMGLGRRDLKRLSLLLLRPYSILLPLLLLLRELPLQLYLQAPLSPSPSPSPSPSRSAVSAAAVAAAAAPPAPPAARPTPSSAAAGVPCPRSWSLAGACGRRRRSGGGRRGHAYHAARRASRRGRLGLRRRTTVGHGSGENVSDKRSFFVVAPPLVKRCKLL
jgi:hypothetical protein